MSPWLRASLWLAWVAAVAGAWSLGLLIGLLVPSLLVLAMLALLLWPTRRRHAEQLRYVQIAKTPVGAR